MLKLQLTPPKQIELMLLLSKSSYELFSGIELADAKVSFNNKPTTCSHMIRNLDTQLSSADLSLLKSEGILKEYSDDQCTVANLLPDNWPLKAGKLSLFFGTSLMLTGILFFFAWNWQNLEPWHKLTLLGSGITLSWLGSELKGIHSLLGKVLLLSAAILVGVFMAVFGQIYQTGADPWQLFIGWAVLITPWVCISHNQELWLVWAIIAETGIVLWANTTLESSPWHNWEAISLIIALLPSMLMVLSDDEIFHRFNLKKPNWLSNTYGNKLMTFTSCIIISSSVFASIIEIDHIQSSHMLSYLALVSWCLWSYCIKWLKHKESFSLILIALSLSTLLTTLIGRGLLEVLDNEGGFMLMFFIVTGIFTGAALWLREQLQNKQLNEEL
ncbi:MAG: DUF2157 domain-containing protein [Planctomycetes bacterium]|nr:DUF2157 domain-containing protein [Planctomycetota bacterium]